MSLAHLLHQAEDIPEDVLAALAPPVPGYTLSYRQKNGLEVWLNTVTLGTAPRTYIDWHDKQAPQKRYPHVTGPGWQRQLHAATPSPRAVEQAEILCQAFGDTYQQYWWAEGPGLEYIQGAKHWYLVQPTHQLPDGQSVGVVWNLFKVEEPA